MMGSNDQQFCLRWNNYSSNIVSAFKSLLSDEDLVDVTLACEDHVMKAHKVVLSACSPYFRALFKANPCQHPIVFLKDMKKSDLQSIMDFMYLGQANVSQEHLTNFLKTAEALKVRGLTDDKNKKEDRPEADEGSTHSQYQSRESSPYNASSPIPREPPPTSHQPPPLKRMKHSSNLLPAATSSPVPAKHTPPSIPLTPPSVHSELQPSASVNSAVPVVAKTEPVDYSSDVENTSQEHLSVDVKPSSPVDYDYSHDGGDDSYDSEIIGPDLSGSNLPGNSLHEGSLSVPSTSHDPGGMDSTQGLISQLFLNPDDVPRCPVCERVFSNRGNMHYHLRHVHQNTQGLQCAICKKGYKNQNSLRVHVYTYHQKQPEPERVEED